MDGPSIDVKSEILDTARENGFIRARIAALFRPDDHAAPGSRTEGAPAALVVALPYGNVDPDTGEYRPRGPGPAASSPNEPPRVCIDLFSRRNYYTEAVRRLQSTAKTIRARHGGAKADFRIFCNSPIAEKTLATACGLGVRGRNSLIITPEAGSLVIIAALTLPFKLPGDGPVGENPCEACRACVNACPTAALPGDGTVDRTRCLQWFLSRPGTVPREIAAKWGNRLYGCSVCREVCPSNVRRIPGTPDAVGPLPEWFDARELERADDATLTRRFKGTALGMSWFGPEAIRRNARLGSSGTGSNPENDHRGA